MCKLNSAHTPAAAWLNAWVAHVAFNPLPNGLNLYPLEQALRMAGAEIRPRMTGPEFFAQFLYMRN